MHTIVQNIDESLNTLQRYVDEQRAVLFDLQKNHALLDVDMGALQAYMKKPYIMRALRGDRFELIIPRFLNFSAGWPVRVEGEYNVFAVSRMIDLFTPLPDWMRAELGWEKSDFSAYVDGGNLVVTSGDVSKLYDRLGAGKNFARKSGNQFTIIKNRQYQILRDLIRMGVLPYRPKPVSVELVRDARHIDMMANGKSKIVLRPKQQRDFEIFLKFGAVSVIAPGGAGKTFFGMKGLETIKGRKIIFAPRNSILEQWKIRIKMFAPWLLHEVEFMTYQAALRRKKPFPHYALMIADEIQTMPSDMGIKVANISTDTRIGLTATPWREDGQEDMIPATCGVVVGLDWDTNRNTDAIVWIVDNEEAKIKMVEKILAQKTSGKTFVYVYRLNVGDKIAKRLRVPFVSGKTKNQYDTIMAADVVVVSKVADAGISANVTRIIEVDWLGGRQEIGQRALRTAHSEHKSEAHFLMTKAEMKSQGYRLAALSALQFEVKVMGA